METFQNPDFSVGTLRDFLRVVFKRLPLVITLVVVVTAAVTASLMMKTPLYEAKVKMLISAKKLVETPFYSDLSGYNSTEKITVTQSEIVKSTPILQRTVDALGLYARPLDYEKQFASPLKKWVISRQFSKSDLVEVKPGERPMARFRLALEDLRKNIDMEPIRDTSTFLIKVRDYSPIGAALIANTLSRSYLIFDLEQQLSEVQMKYGGKHPSVIQLRESINKIIKTLNGTPISDIEAIGPASVKVIEQASPPLHPVSLSKKPVVIAAFGMSLILGIILAFAFEYLDPTFKTLRETEKFLHLPALGSVPKSKRKRPAFNQSLVDQIYLLMKDKGLKSILITPLEMTNSGHQIISELGRMMADKGGQKVLLIDADFKAPQLHKIFKTNLESGLAEILEGKTTFEKALKNSGPNLGFLTAGRTSLNSVALLDSERMSELLKLAREKYSFIFVASSALIRSKDAVLISSRVDGTALVIEEGRTRREVAKAALEAFDPEKNRLLGTIQNNRTFPIPKLIYDRV